MTTEIDKLVNEFPLGFCKGVVCDYPRTDCAADVIEENSASLGIELGKEFPARRKEFCLKTRADLSVLKKIDSSKQ